MPKSTRQPAEIERRRRLYFKGRAPVSVAGRAALVVDDGIATGATMRAALRAIRRRLPAKLILAVPVGPASTIEALRREVDEVVCLATPRGSSMPSGNFMPIFARSKTRRSSPCSTAHSSAAVLGRRPLALRHAARRPQRQRPSAFLEFRCSAGASAMLMQVS